ncbi:MAG: phosphatidate cytidylyltransferase [Gemmatimonadetes bacterium]|nr:phosphatidate cytidylyltransferase [Gemmatimonadota bacterium]
MAHQLARRIGVAAIGIPATIGLIYLGGWTLVAGLAVIGALGAFELYRLAARQGVRALVAPGCIGAALIPAAAWLALPAGYALAPRWFAFLLALWLMGVMAAAVATRGPNHGPTAGVGVTVLGALYAGGLPTFLLLLRHPAPPPGAMAGTALACFPLVLTWICDTLAMAGGALIGGPKLAPVLSPAKTWAGAVTGTLGALLAAIGYGRWVLAPLGVPLSLAILLASGAAVATLGQLGDVAESLFKREAGVKDSGALFPGHGGVLDRLDSLYWAVPAVALVVSAGGGL